MSHILTQVVLCISVDVSSDYNQVESVIKQVRLHCWQEHNMVDDGRRTDLTSPFCHCAGSREAGAC